MKRVYSDQNLAYVNLFRSWLSSHGIDSQIRNEHVSSVMGEIPFFLVSPECWVAEDDYERAKSLLTEFLEPATTRQQGEERQCLICCETSPTNFAICWNCQNPLE